MGEVQARLAARFGATFRPYRRETLRGHARGRSRALSPLPTCYAPCRGSTPRGGRRPHVSREVRSRGMFPGPRALALRSTPAGSGSG
eukprot:5122421-Prymnesium_polylepis.1